MRLPPLVLLFTALIVLAACGASTSTSPAGSPTKVPPASAAATTATTATAGQSTYQGIPVSRTAEGYHVLGRIDAPATIEFYSDFL